MNVVYSGTVALLFIGAGVGLVVATASLPNGPTVATPVSRHGTLAGGPAAR